MTIRVKVLLVGYIILSFLFSASCITVNHTTMLPTLTTTPPSTSTKVSEANSELGLVKSAIGAAMADQRISTIKAGTLDSSHPLIVGGSTAGTYIQGTNTTLVGVYTVDTNGNVVKGSYPGATWSNNNFH